jgi:hypothetical protein
VARGTSAHFQLFFISLLLNFRGLSRDGMWFLSRLNCCIPVTTYDRFIKEQVAEQENIINEVLEYDKKQIEIINKNTFLKPHDFFYINTNSQRIFSNFNEMVFENKFII